MWYELYLYFTWRPQNVHFPPCHARDMMCVIRRWHIVKYGQIACVWGALQKAIHRLTHLPLMPHICVNGFCQHWSCAVPSHYLNQYWIIINWTFGNNLQWNSNQNTKFSFMKMHLIISSPKRRPFCPGGDELTHLSLTPKWRQYHKR